MNSGERKISTGTVEPALLIAGVSIVILGQLWPAIPIAGGIALAGWGTALATPVRGARQWLALLVYAPLVVLAIGSQIDSARSESLLRQFMAALDAGIAGGLMVRLAQHSARR